MGGEPVFLRLEGRSRDWELVLTTKGRVRLDPRVVDREELLRSLHEIWEDNQRTMSEEERATLKRLSSASHPVAKTVGVVLLLLGLAGVIYSFAVFLPNLEV